MVEAGGVTRFIPKSMFSMLSSLFGKVLFDFGGVRLHLPPAYSHGQLSFLDAWANLLLLALNNSTETDPLWSLHGAGSRNPSLASGREGDFISVGSPPIAGSKAVLPQRWGCLKHHKVAPTHEDGDFSSDSGHNRYVTPSPASFCFRR